MDSNRLVIKFLFDPAYDVYDKFGTTQNPPTMKAFSGPIPVEDDTIPVEDIVDSASGSLEALHNLYHGLIGGGGDHITGNTIIGGGGGHMSAPSLAAFDPIFVSVSDEKSPSLKGTRG